MLIILCSILLLQIGFTYNKESDCGCGANNDRRNNFVQENTNSEFYNEKSQQCSMPKENKNTEKDWNEDMVLIPSNEYQVGTDDVVMENDKEGPMNLVHIKSFYLDKYEVSNRDFYKFAKLTNFKTEAETFGDSFVFTLFLNTTTKDKLKDFRVVQAPWWYKVTGANWQHPHGPDSNILGK
jgi:formylglycine-generating enzyme